jgi:hypothetical protein
MKTKTECTQFTPALRKIAAVLIAAFLAALSTGAAAQMDRPSQPAAGAPPPTQANAKAIKPVVVELRIGAKDEKIKYCEGGCCSTPLGPVCFRQVSQGTGTPYASSAIPQTAGSRTFELTIGAKDETIKYCEGGCCSTPLGPVCLRLRQ